jgi:hypothetical protein
MKKTTFLAVLIPCLILIIGISDLNGDAKIQEDNTETPVIPVTGKAIEAAAGLQGPLSFFQVGLMFPEVKKNMFVGLKLKYLSSLNYVTFIDPADSGKYISFHPVVIGAVFSIGGCSPVTHGFMKAYGGMDLLIGSSSTPYDDLVYNTGNLMGDNVTFIISGYFGLEMFTNEKTSIFIDAGGGFKAVSGDEDNMYVSASSWIGSGFNFKMGVRFYSPKKRVD